MAANLEKTNINSWLLDSGVWEKNTNSQGFSIVKNNKQRQVSSLLTAAELQKIMGLPTHAKFPDALYPPEFGYCPETGQPLVASAASDNNTWVSPIGLNPLPDRKSGVVRGLNQSDFSFNVANLAGRKEIDDAQFTLSLPPSGDYQFFAIKANSAENLLIALDPASGALFAYLPEQKEWHVLEHEKHLLLSGTKIDLVAWRCESQNINNTTYLYIPTDHGLALLKIDVLSMNFDVEYFGDSQCLASPIYYLDSIWQPVVNQAGDIELLNYSLTSKTIEKMVLANGQNLKLTQIQAPISTTRFVVWLCQQGQIILERTVKGLELKFLAWPSHIQPVFNMGCAYLSADGSLYQLCIDAIKDNNLYVQINNNSFGSYPSETPRLCSGSYNFHLTNKYKSAPWLTPEVASESTTNAEVVRIVLPLLESNTSGNVLGLSFELSGDKSVASLLESHERERAVLVLDDSDSQTSIFSFTVPKPWRLRFFNYQNILWAYHPEMKNIVGWSQSV